MPEPVRAPWVGVMSLMGLAGALLTASCTYWYTVDQAITGPSVILSVEQPGQVFTLRACLTGATADDMAVTVIARAQIDQPSGESPAELALTLETPGDWDEPSSSQSEVAPTGTTHVVEAVRLDFDRLGVMCEHGMVVTLERLDGALAGQVSIEWTAYVSAGSGSAEIKDGDLVLDVG